MKNKKHGKNYIALLCALLVFSLLMLCACSPRPSADPPAKPGVQSSVSAEGPVDTPEEPSITITISDLKKYITQSSSVTELAQRFFKDTIVYKDSLGQYVFEPVNEDLPKSDYDWDNLKNVSLTGKELEYQENGQTVSLKGIDVSRYQGTIDWEKVASDGVDFAIIRLGYRGYGPEGKFVLDSEFENNIKGATQNGIPVGVYFVTQAVSVEEGIEEANFVLNAIAPYKVTWPIVMDIEDAAGTNARTKDLEAKERTDLVAAFCDRIKEAGYTPMLYCNIRWFIEELELDRLTAYDKWFAQYYNRPFFPYEFSMWQYTNSGKVKGIEGNVDLNISMKDYAKKD